MRHSCGYYLADRGTDLRTMQDYLGHRDPRHTVHYTRVSGRRFEAIWLDAQLQKLPGKSDLAGAIRYARSRWTELTRYLDDGRLEISNNAAENQIRPAVLGRKNWLF